MDCAPPWGTPQSGALGQAQGCASASRSTPPAPTNTNPERDIGIPPKSLLVFFDQYFLPHSHTIDTLLNDDDLHTLKSRSEFHVIYDLSRRDTLKLAGVALGGLATGCSVVSSNLMHTQGDRMTQEKTFDAGPVKINYLDYGVASDDSLVMLHGGAWCWKEFVSLIPPLASTSRIFALAGRGNGASGWVPNRYRLRDFADDASCFVSRLDGQTVLLGHSIGGVTALMTAAQCPQKVKALIIEDAPLTLDGYREVINSSRDMFTTWLELKQAARSKQELGLLLAAKYSNAGVTSSWILFFAECLWRLDPTYFNVLLNDFDDFVAGYDYRAIFSTVRCPVLFIRGAKSLGAVMTDAEVAFIRSRFGPSSYVEIQGVGHLLHLQDQGQVPVLHAISEFLRSIPAPPLPS